MIRASFVAALLLFACIGIARGETTGNDLYDQLTSSESNEHLIAYAYLKGMLDAEDFYLMAEMSASLGPKRDKEWRFKNPHFCLGSDKLTMGQIKDIVLKYLTDHPEKRHHDAYVLVKAALLEDFPCAYNPEPREVK